MRKSSDKQLNLLSSAPDQMQWAKLPLKVQQEIELGLAQSLLSIISKSQSITREAHHANQN